MITTVQAGATGRTGVHQNEEDEAPGRQTRDRQTRDRQTRDRQTRNGPRDSRLNRRNPAGPDPEGATGTGDWDPGDPEDLIDRGNTDEPGQMDLSQFIETYKDAIARTVTEAYAPRYQPGKPGQGRQGPVLIRRPMGAQAHAVRGAALSLEINPGTIIVGEMGTGKTYIGAAAAHMAGCRNILVLAPPHLVQKWKREIEMTVPRARAAIVRTITDLKTVRKPDPGSGIQFTIMSREAAKLSYRWQAACVTRLLPVKDGGRKINCCPGCFKQIRDKDGIPVPVGELQRKRMKCPECAAPSGSRSWSSTRPDAPAGDAEEWAEPPPKYRNRKYALADYIKKRMKGFFDLLIADEVHEYKARGSAQGIAGGNLAQACGRILTLTGTLAGGYSSTLFHLLYRFTPEIRNEFQHNQQGRWIDRYGFRQKKYRNGGRDDEAIEHGSSSGRRGYRKLEKETPGLAPAALFHIIGNTVFLRLSDVSTALPPYEELIQVQQMSRKLDPGTGYSQKTAYQKLYQELRDALKEALSRGSTRLMAAYLQSLLAFPDGCTRGEEVTDPEDDRVIVSIPPLDEDETYPKEQALIDLLKEENRAGRRALVYTPHTDTRDLTPRIEQFLNREGIRTAVLKSGTIKSERRKEWVGRRVKEGVDALICNPRLVQTGLDLVDFPTIVWYETDYSVYTMRQASRRSWRIGQTRPVKVVFMVYENTIQTEALRLVARKMQSSLAVEGELPEDGLTAFGDDSQDLIMTLARQIINEADFQGGDSLENIFDRAREAERESERYLVDDEWDNAAAEPEPEKIPVTTGADSTEPAKPGPEQTSIFSWAEFMAQPVEETSRRRQKEPDTPSLFQWAVEQETAVDQDR